jgi:hypothetical protein
MISRHQVLWFECVPQISCVRNIILKVQWQWCWRGETFPRGVGLEFCLHKWTNSLLGWWADEWMSDCRNGFVAKAAHSGMLCCVTK